MLLHVCPNIKFDPLLFISPIYHWPPSPSSSQERAEFPFFSLFHLMFSVLPSLAHQIGINKEGFFSATFLIHHPPEQTEVRAQTPGRAQEVIHCDSWDESAVLGRKTRMCPQPGADEQKAKGPGRYLYLGTLGDSIPKLFVKKDANYFIPVLVPRDLLSEGSRWFGIMWGTRAGVSDFPPVPILYSEAPKQDGPGRRSQVPSRVSRWAWAGPCTVSTCVETPLKRIYVTCVTKESVWKILSSRSIHAD